MQSLIRKLDWRHKNNKFIYSIKALSRELWPTFFFTKKLATKLNTIAEFDREYVKKRVNYYNKLKKSVSLSTHGIKLSELSLSMKPSAYYFDAYEYTRYFNQKLKAIFLFGDITYVPEFPSLVKSRPIGSDTECSVLLKLDKSRHFMFVKDKNDFSKKKNMLVGRAVVKQPHRISFYELYFNHPLCDLGQINRDRNIHWIKDRLSIEEHLKFKFILCIEGYDVATNLKWVMSSNSLAVMPKPKYETWFMEGLLIPNHHYVEIKNDYSDLEERLTYYIEHPHEALQISKNANEFVKQFRNKNCEDLISLLVLEKYFYQTGQDFAAISNPEIFKES